MLTNVDFSLILFRNKLLLLVPDRSILFAFTWNLLPNETQVKIMQLATKAY